MTLRHFAIIVAVTLALDAAGVRAPASAEPRHGLSIFGVLKYPADFKNFDYVNPDAPKGGRIVTMGTSGANSYDSFNAFILKGDKAQGLAFLFDSLMTRASDEPDAMYGLVASSEDVAADGLSVTFKLRPEARKLRCVHERRNLPCVHWRRMEPPLERPHHARP